VDRHDTIRCPFCTPEEVLNFDPWETFGERDRAELTRRFETHYQANCRERPFGVNMTGIYTTLISGFIDIFGWEMLLLAAGTDLQRFGALANRYAAWMQVYFDALANADAPVVMIHDDIVWSSGPFLRPAWYREFLFPNYARYFAPLLESGKKVIFCSDGNFDAFVDDIAGTGVHGFVFEPLTDLDGIVERYGQTHVIVGNADTRVLLSGTREQIRAEVQRCLSAGRDCPGFFMAVGNHIPANTPVENALYYNQVYEELCWR
jgi:uroporphyrinogen-III decarboxylase